MKWVQTGSELNLILTRVFPFEKELSGDWDLKTANVV